MAGKGRTIKNTIIINRKYSANGRCAEELFSRLIADKVLSSHDEIINSQDIDNDHNKQENCQHDIMLNNVVLS